LPRLSSARGCRQAEAGWARCRPGVIGTSNMHVGVHGYSANNIGVTILVATLRQRQAECPTVTSPPLSATKREGS
jgi:hypothetical protein